MVGAGGSVRGVMCDRASVPLQEAADERAIANAELSPCMHLILTVLCWLR